MKYLKFSNFKYINIRIDLCLTYILKFSRNYIQKLINKKKIFINNFIIKKKYIIKKYDIIYIKNIYIINKYMWNKNLNILYEDNYILIINKPYNLVVHPIKNKNIISLLDILYYKYKYLTILKKYKIGLINRLDKDTTGIILIAKNLLTLLFLQNQFKNHLIKKTYITIVIGIFSSKKNFFIKKNIKKCKNSIKMRLNKFGKIAITKFKILKQLKYHTVLKCYPITGRTHQIRLHLNSINKSILNDKIYKNNFFKCYKKIDKLKLKNIFIKFNRLALHSYSIKFLHPFYKKKIKIKCKLPKDFIYFINKWK
ncbi:MAG: RluA family pseudouridine synthase [Candidatus Shikimatogenerans sp. AspAUS03]|uniref:Pseudouridine synthase n=1 Tax=Candidatus Shikimatogenerans sp. AspAUS03 TaxID=3158563 RepID=A0AAU7QSR9_9FLAO